VVCAINYWISTLLPGWTDRVDGPAVRKMKLAKEIQLLQDYTYFCPTSWMDDYQYQIFMAITVWMICMYTGLTMELIFGSRIVQYFETHESMHWLWIYSNCLFPILTFCGMLSHSTLGLPVFLLGLFKFGFPEIAAYLHRAQKHQFLSMHWWCDAISGTAMLFHHGAATLIVVLYILDIISMEKWLGIVFIIVLLQHVVVILRYIRRKTYVVLSLSLEIWFQIECLGFALRLSGKDVVFQLCCFMMVESHMMFLLAGAIDMYIEWEETKRKVEIFESGILE